METPIQRAIDIYRKKDHSRLHMPGHKGAAFDLFAPLLPYDVTEIPGTDSLYEASGCIRECEAAYERIYGTKRTLLSAGGSTLCIQTMLTLAAKPGDVVVAGRNLHQSAVNTMALLDLQPVWIYPQQNPGGVGGEILPEELEGTLSNCPQAKAVYVTSPDYFGVLSDIEALAEICRRHRVPLLVDNAHGAHLPFCTNPSLHPIALGAALCCDSLHKTLPVLTGGALLHIGKEEFVFQAKQKMSMYGSTSPSYLILLSIDRNLDYLANRAEEDLRETACKVEWLRALAREKGLFVPPKSQLCDPVRLSLGFLPAGYDRESFRVYLERCQIEPEYLSDTGCVLLPSARNRPVDFQRLELMLRGLPVQPGRTVEETMPIPRPERKLSLREALFRPAKALPVEECVGKICACVQSPCPPGIPVVMPGEILHKELIKFLKKSGIYECNVLE